MLMPTSNNAAQLIYGPNDFRIKRAGQHVICSVSGAIIPLAELRYWSADRQEAYASAVEATKALMQPS